MRLIKQFGSTKIIIALVASFLIYLLESLVRVLYNLVETSRNDKMLLVFWNQRRLSSFQKRSNLICSIEY